MKIPSQLVIISGFALILGLLLVMALLDLHQMASNQERMETVVSQHSAKIDRLNALRHIARERSVIIFQTLISEDPFVAGEMRERMANLASEFIASTGQLQTMPLSPQERTNLKLVLTQASIVAALHTEVMDLMEAGEFATARQRFINERLQDQNKLMSIYANIIDMQRSLTKEALADARNTYHRAITTTVVLGSAMITIGLLVSLFVIGNTARIEHNLGTLNSSLEQRVAQRTAALETTNAVLQQTIEELKSTQTQLVQSEKMASLGNLVAGMAHEINTPLGVSVTSASSMQVETLALRKALDTGSIKRSDMTSYMEFLEQSCTLLLANLKRATTLVGSLKLVAVDQSSQDWREINLHAYIDEIIVSLHPRIKKTRITVHNKSDPDINIHTNPGAIYQIVSNLVVNSMTHAFGPEDQGNITIRSGSNATQLILEYLDDGKGIPGEHIDRVFEPFFTTRRGSGGSGLGLHIVYNLVTSTLQGTISVKSDLGSGVAFRITFPIKKPMVHP